jgi:hypothetical protein
MQEVSIKSIQEMTLESLGLDKDKYDIVSIEAIAAQIRRAASFLCPCAPKTIVQAVVNVSKCLAGDPETFEQKTKDVLEKMVSYGDLIEGDDWRLEENERTRILYRVPPGFIVRKSGQFLLFGIGPSGKISLPIELKAQVEQKGYVRWLKQSNDDKLAEILLECGLTEVASDTWLRLPSAMNYDDYLMMYDQRLVKSSFPGDLGSLSVIDPKTSVNYYRSRWHLVSNESGRFICRRPRPYGSDLWCYVELDNGKPTRLLDLPIDTILNRGCDEAWRLQAAIDARNNTPQKLVVIDVSDRFTQLNFYSPIPMWAQRRLDMIGKLGPESKSCLFSYLLGKEEVSQELDCLKRMMWLKVEFT